MCQVYWCHIYGGVLQRKILPTEKIFLSGSVAMDVVGIAGKRQTPGGEKKAFTG